MKRLIVTGATGKKIRQAVLAAPEYREGQPEILSITEFDQAVLEAARGRSRRCGAPVAGQRGFRPVPELHGAGPTL